MLMRAIVLFWLLCLLATCVRRVDAVNRNKFKTCKQSNFCSRQREYFRPVSPYVAMLDKATILNASLLQIPILNKDTDDDLLASISILADSIIRLRITEGPKSIRARFEATAALIPLPDALKFNIRSHTEEQILVQAGDVKIQVKAVPFVVYIYDETSSTVPRMSFNSANMLNFEKYNFEAKTGRKPETVRQPADDGVEEVLQDPPESCQEDFQGHMDSNPHCHASVGADITFWNTEHVYGIPEHADSFALRSTRNTDPYRLFNLDVFEYELNNPMALYGSIPVMLGHSADKTGGVFWLNAAETWIDIDSTADVSKQPDNATQSNPAESKRRVRTRWMSETGNIDVFFMMGPRPKDVFKQYARLTGTTSLPPVFSLGFHQSRWNYFNQSEVLGILHKFEEHRLPLDVIWLDIEYTNERRYFTWDSEMFPDPIKMTNELTALGRKLVVIVDPHIKADPSYAVYKTCKDSGFNVRNKDKKSDFHGHCWPDDSTYIDFLNPAARSWYSNNFNLSRFPGTTLDTYLWNDMNEPSVFNGPEITIPKDTVHFGGFENREVHNIYGMMQQMSTTSGLLKRSAFTRRPFVLTRAFFAGSQRAGAAWTGDNTHGWNHLAMSIPMVLSMSITGLSNVGADVGGFFEPMWEDELFVRWHQLGAFLPFYRVHSHLESRRREPWHFDKDVMELIRNTLRLRYTMLPYWYTLFFENEVTGFPPMRPLWSVFPQDSSVFNTESSYMLGDSMLVSPVLKAGTGTNNLADVEVYLPGAGEQWFDPTGFRYDGGERYSLRVHLDMIPRFQRGGTIIPYKERWRRSATAMVNDPFTLRIALNLTGQAEGTVYVDDYTSLQYKTNKRFSFKNIVFDNNSIYSRHTLGDLSFPSNEWIERIVVFGYSQPPKKISVIDGIGKVSALGFHHAPDDNKLTIRKPGVAISSSSWRITIKL